MGHVLVVVKAFAGYAIGDHIDDVEKIAVILASDLIHYVVRIAVPAKSEK